MVAGEAVTLRGSISRRIFYNRDDGFAVLSVVPSTAAAGEAMPESITVRGVMRGAAEGIDVEVTGRWVEHARYGAQIQADLIVPRIDDAAGLTQYLASGEIEGVGPVLAERIVAHFGPGAVEAIRAEPRRLEEVEGIGPARARLIAESVAEHCGAGEIMVFLHSVGMGPQQAQRIYRDLGDRAVERIRANPYLLSDLRGIGFETADAIARQLGVEPGCSQRIEAGVAHAIAESMRASGDTVISVSALLRACERLLEVPVVDVKASVRCMLESGQLRAWRGAGEMLLALARVADMEMSAAHRIRRLVGARREEEGIDLSQAARYSPVTLAEGQARALVGSLENRVAVITGGPGTGKSTLTRAILDAAAALLPGCRRFELAAPTGRAARRLAEATAREAKTLHRLLRIDPESGQCGLEGSIEADLVLIDEFSMVDTMVFGHLLEHMDTETRLLIVGDVDQLPSVGAGQVLKDLIDAEVAPVYRLNTVFRNAGAIKRGAAQVRGGLSPLALTGEPEANFAFVARAEPSAEDVVAQVRNLETRDGIPARDVQVLAPMRRGEVGIHALNSALQKALVGDPKALARKLVMGSTAFLVGDRVMQTANREMMDVYGRSCRVNNGDVGYVSAIDLGTSTLCVDFEDARIAMKRADLLDLTLAYAVTVHKAQGCEYRGVVMPVAPEHGFMWIRGRRILYTGMTRASERLVWVGNEDVVRSAVIGSQERDRRTGLAIALEMARHSEHSGGARGVPR